MIKFTILPVLFAVFCVVNAQQGPCTTASGGQGQCKSIYNCQPLLDIVNKANRTPQDMDLLKKSHCGFDGQAPAVCCPANNEPQKPSNECFTPAGEPGQCVNLYTCPAIANLLKPPVSSNIVTFVQQSRCSGPDQYSVCCGPVPDFNNVEKGNCASRVTEFPPDPRTECCGLDGSTKNKIVGGSPTSVDSYPWLVLIEYLRDGVLKTLCGGALISGKYVLTAAHCVTGPSLNRGGPISIRLGEYNTSNVGSDCMKTEEDVDDCSDGAISIPIEATIPHPQYNPASTHKRNDIALIRMTQMAPYTEFIRPICLPAIDRTQGAITFNTTVAGWGAVSTKQSSSNVKLHVEIPFVSQSVCQPAYSIPGRNVPFWKGQFCAGGEKGKDSCKGDSGGPLMYENGRIFEAIGIVSFGPLPCGLEDIPGVYTNVYEYNTWIRSKISPFQLPTSFGYYPWLALIEYVKDGVLKTLCGGALISGKYVLTAAHCVTGPILTRITPTSIRLGEYDTSHEGPDCNEIADYVDDCSDGAIRIPIEMIIPHSQYYPVSPQKHGLRNDIALIKMTQMAPYTDFIRPICLPTIDRTQGTVTFNASIAGWGTGSRIQSSSNVLMHVQIPFVNKSVCQPAYSIPDRNVPFWKGQFCAGGEKGKDSCKGDSGGPLMYENGRIFEAIGIFSFGSLPCGLEDIPGVYTNVYEYNTWIRSKISP